MILTTKEIALICDCTERTAERYVSKIKKKNGVCHVTKFHLADYLGLDFFAVEASYQVKIVGNFPFAVELLRLRDVYLDRRQGYLNIEIYKKVRAYGKELEDDSFRYSHNI